MICGEGFVSLKANARLSSATVKPSMSASVHTLATSSRLWASELRVTAYPSALGSHSSAFAVRESSTASNYGVPSGADGIEPSEETTEKLGRSICAAM